MGTAISKKAAAMLTALITALTALCSCSVRDAESDHFWIDYGFSSGAFGDEGSVYFSTFERNEYFWDGSGVSLVPEEEVPALLAYENGEFFAYDSGNICRFDTESGSCEPIFAIPEHVDFTDFWAQDGALYGIIEDYYEYYYSERRDEEVNNLIYRYDIADDRLDKLTVLNDIRDAEGYEELRVLSIVGVRILCMGTYSGEHERFWIDISDGSIYPYSIGGRICGVRGGKPIICELDSGEYIIYDIETGGYESFDVPEEIYDAESGFELIAIGEKVSYYRCEKDYDKFFYTYKNGKLSELFVYNGISVSDSRMHTGLLDGIFFFVFVGLPADGYQPSESGKVYDLAQGYEKKERTRTVHYCAALPSGEVYILAKETFDQQIQDFG